MESGRSHEKTQSGIWQKLPFSTVLAKELCEVL